MSRRPLPYQAQVDHIREWAAKNIRPEAALASGMMTSHFSTVFFGPENRLRFAGVIPFGDPHRPYHFYFYPGGDRDAICAAEMVGDLSTRKPITVLLPREKGFDGTITLQVMQEGGMRYVVAMTDFAYDAHKYKGKYYLLTLGPSSVSGAEPSAPDPSPASVPLAPPALLVTGDPEKPKPDQTQKPMGLMARFRQMLTWNILRI